MTERPYRIHESTQRGLCRLAFACLGVLPLIACVCISAATLLPGFTRWQAKSWEKQLAKHYGLATRIGQVQTLAPYRYHLEGIELYHPESQRLIGSIASANVRLDQGKWSLELTTAQLRVDQFSEGCRVIHDWYVCRPLAQRHRAAIAIDQLLIDAGDRSLKISSVEAELFPEPTKWTLQATFASDADSGDHQANPVPATNQLIVVRHHAAEEAATDVQLQAASRLPLWLFEASQDRLSHTASTRTTRQLLTSGQFIGALAVRYSARETNYLLTNSWITELDMSLFGSNVPSMISGRANLFVHQAKFTFDGLQCAEGMFQMGSGRMDARLFHSLSQQLELVTPRQNPTQSIAFDRVAAHFRIQPDVFQLVGGLEGGGMIVDAQGSLAARGDASAMPISNLIHALAAAPGSAQLVRSALVWLPLEEAQRRETSGILRISRNP